MHCVTFLCSQIRISQNGKNSKTQSLSRLNPPTTLMEMHYEEIHDLSNNIQKADNGITSHSHEQDKNEYVAKACQKHDEKSRSMNTPETGYYEKEAAELIIYEAKIQGEDSS